jgi:hypothetical protein
VNHRASGQQRAEGVELLFPVASHPVEQGVGVTLFKVGVCGVIQVASQGNGDVASGDHINVEEAFFNDSAATEVKTQRSRQTFPTNLFFSAAPIPGNSSFREQVSKSFEFVMRKEAIK